MRLDPLGESFLLRVEDCDDALQRISRFAARRGKVLDDNQSKVVFQVGSSVLFLLLGTFYERGRRSLPVKVTVSVPSDRTGSRLHVEMESQERGYLIRARWLVAAFYSYFRDLYAELQTVTGPEPHDA